MINYPNGKNHFKPISSHSKRGMQLEDDINATNKYYLINNIAIIHKKPIPIQIVEVDYPNRKNAMIKKAFYKTPSTTDYNGLWHKKYIDFEAKETNSKTAFALKNIHEHQIHHMTSVYRHGGISFIIVRFKTIDRTFIMPTKKLLFFYDRAKNNGRKSITLKEFETNAFEISFNYKIRVDYLAILQNYESEFY